MLLIRQYPVKSTELATLLLQFLDDGIVLLAREFAAQCWFPFRKSRVLAEPSKQCQLFRKHLSFRFVKSPLGA